MKDLGGVVVRGHRGGKVDQRALLVGAGVPPRGHHHHERGVLVPLDLAKIVQCAVARGEDQVQQVGPHPVQQDLALGVPEPDVELQHLDVASVDHQAGEDDPLEGAALLPQAPHQRLHHPRHDLGLHALRDDGGGRVGPHAARVRPHVSVVRRLVVLGRVELDGGPVGVDDDEEARLLSRQEVLDHDRGARVAKLLAEEHGLHGRLGVGEVLGDHDALSRRQPVRLDDDGEGSLRAAEVREGRLGLVKGLVRGRGDAVLAANVLHEGLGALKLGGGAGRPEGPDPPGPQRVRQAGNELGLRADDHERNALPLAELHDRLVIVAVQVGLAEEDGVRLQSDAGIAGGAIHPTAPAAPGEAPHEGVLPTAPADDENSDATLALRRQGGFFFGDPRLYDGDAVSREMGELRRAEGERESVVQSPEAAARDPSPGPSPRRRGRPRSGGKKGKSPPASRDPRSSKHQVHLLSHASRVLSRLLPHPLPFLPSLR